MARCIPDPISGLPWRPFKSLPEMDAECETALRQFLGLAPEAPIPLPLSTDLLTTMIEAEAERLDLFAALGPDVEGCTDITAQGRPWVRINQRLSTAPQRAYRLRNTLAHEWYHVHVHAPLYQAQLARAGHLALAAGAPAHAAPRPVPRVTPGPVDWREWQAGYGAGALLMPRTAVQALLGTYRARYGVPPYGDVTEAAAAVTLRVGAACEVSLASARIRLEQLGLVVTPGAGGARSALAQET